MHRTDADGLTVQHADTKRIRRTTSAVEDGSARRDRFAGHLQLNGNAIDRQELKGNGHVPARPVGQRAPIKRFDLDTVIIVAILRTIRITEIHVERPIATPNAHH